MKRSKRNKRGLYKSQAKYEQMNKAIGVRFDPGVYNAIVEMADEKRWSLASTVAWCVEQQLDVEPTIRVSRRRP